ncbi:MULTISPECIES: transposase, partial [unclassified Corallococcus]
MWAPIGEQALVRITGENAKRTLWGAINPRSGRRVVMATQRSRQEDFMAFLHALRSAYPGRPLLLVLDRASCHTAQKSQRLAARLGVHLVLLPKQRSELNCMDHLWRPLKQRVSANRQYSTMEQHVAAAIRWVVRLSPQDALRKAGCLAEG